MKKTTPTTAPDTPDIISGDAALFAGIVAGQANARTREALTHLLLWIAEGGTCGHPGASRTGLRDTHPAPCQNQRGSESL